MSEPYEVALAKHKDEVDKKIAEFEERQKARDPNILSAARTLVEDLAAYTRGDRADFPKDALLGVFGAYLRPRVVIVFGSIIAILIAAAEFWLIYQQNHIIERQTEIMQEQNRLVERQARLARADTAARLLPALREEDALASADRILIATYGNVATEVLLPILRLGYKDSRDSQAAYLWMNSAEVVISRAKDLRPEESLEVALLTLEALDTARWDVETKLALRKFFPPVTASQVSLNNDSEQSLQNLLRISELFDRQVGKVPFAFVRPALDPDRVRIAQSIADTLVFMRLARVDQESKVWNEQRLLPGGSGLGRLCEHLLRSHDNHRAIWAVPDVGDLNATVARKLMDIEQTYPEANLNRSVEVTVQRICIPDLFPHLADDEDRKIASLAFPEAASKKN